MSMGRWAYSARAGSTGRTAAENSCDLLAVFGGRGEVSAGVSRRRRRKWRAALRFARFERAALYSARGHVAAAVTAPAPVAGTAGTQDSAKPAAARGFRAAGPSVFAQEARSGRGPVRWYPPESPFEAAALGRVLTATAPGSAASVGARPRRCRRSACAAVAAAVPIPTAAGSGAQSARQVPSQSGGGSPDGGP